MRRCEKMWEDVRRCEKMWEDVKMRRCEKMWEDVRRCEDEKMRRRWEDEKMWRWEDVKMRRCEDVKMRRCEDEKMWRWEDEKMRSCEDEKMWRWEAVKMRRCFTDPHYWKNPALRRSREKHSRGTFTSSTAGDAIFFQAWSHWSSKRRARPIFRPQSATRRPLHSCWTRWHKTIGVPTCEKVLHIFCKYFRYALRQHPSVF